MKFLITGATGLVGKALSRLLLKEGHSVNYLTTSSSKIENDDHYQGYLWDTRKQTIDKAAFYKVDIIINLAGASVAERWTSNHKKAIMDSRIDSLNLLYRALSNIEHTVKHIISASAIGVYPHSFTKLFDESEQQLNNEFLGEVVQEWEKHTDQFDKLGLSVSKIRIGIVLSGDGGALEKMASPIKNYVGAPLGDGRQWQSWIHIQDLVRLFLYVAEEELEGVYNAVAPNPVTNQKLTKVIAKQLGKPLLLPPVPKFMLKLLLGEMSTIVISSQRVSAQKILETGFDFKYSLIENALEDIY